MLSSRRLIHITFTCTTWNEQRWNTSYGKHGTIDMPEFDRMNWTPDSVGVLHLIVHPTERRWSRHKWDMLGCFARCVRGSYWVSARVGRSWGHLQVSHSNYPICSNTDLLELIQIYLGLLWWLFNIIYIFWCSGRDILLFPGTAYNHRVHREHRENNNALCSLWLIFFAMIHLSYLIRIN